jgi:hypothetical protein
MYYQITFRHDHLKADLFGRETTEETGDFLSALADDALKYGCSRILVSVHRSKPVFTVGRYGLFSYFDIALRSLLKIALVGDSAELCIAHQYIESLALQRGVNLRAFRDEVTALRWLRAEHAKGHDRVSGETT